MKKLKNTFIPGIIFIIIAVIATQLIGTYRYQHRDTNSYVELMRGSATLNELVLVGKKPQQISTGDSLSTGKDSLTVITWGDGSLTRVGENSQLRIDENSVSEDESLIRISFELLSGKTWSQVVSFISEESFFTQSFDDIEAGVRGTTFDVDLSNDFLRVSDHEVELTNKSGETLILSQGEVMSTKLFSLIEISEFLSKLEDKAWTEINKKFDIEHIRTLTKQLEEDLKIPNPFLFVLEYFSPKYRLFYELDTAKDFERVQKQLEKLSKKQHTNIYDAVFSRYQKLNFVDGNNYEFYKRKIFYKKALVFLADTDSKKEQFLRTSAYDLRDIFESGNDLGIQETLEFLQEHQDIFDTLDFENLKNTTKDFLDSLDTGIKGFLDSTAGSLLDSFKK